MASAKEFIIYLCLLVLVFHEIKDVEARRGGGGSRTSSRSRSSFSSSRAARTYTSVALTGRVLGSSSYTGSTWRAAAMAGYIYGGPRYIRLYSHRQDMPPICTNNYQKSPEGRVYGYFICPRDNESYTFTYCCGPSKREYCCDMAMAREFSSSYRKGGGISIGGIIGIVVAIAIICVVVFICCKKRKQAGLIIHTFSKRNPSQPQDIMSHSNSSHLPPHSTDGSGKQPDHNRDNQSVPLNGPAPAYDGFTPSMPPPSYDAVSAQQSYDGVNSLPYGPPQPQPLPNIDEKSGLSLPDIGDAPQPYWTPYPPAYSHDTSAPSVPYPPASAPTSSDAPYPPPGGAPYPPLGGAPYPTPGDAPYPPPGETPYPTSGETPYPTPYPSSGGTPYPTPGGTPYPTPGETPYPTPGGTPYPTPSGVLYPSPGGAPYPSYGPPNPDSLDGTAK